MHDQERWKRYREAVERLSGGYFVLSRTRVLIEVSQSLCEMLGCNPAQMIGRSPLEFVTPESATRMRTALDSIETTVSRTNRYDALRPDGTTVPILVRSLTHRDAAGEVESAIGFVTDLTEIVEAQKNVAESERELRGILDNLQDTYYRTDARGLIIRASRSALRLLGYRQEEVLGLPLADFYWYPEDRARFLAALAANGGSIEQYECLLRHRSGRAMWVSTSAHFIYDALGKPAGVEGTTRDVTDLRRAREELRLAARVFEVAAQAIVITDPSFAVVSVNPAFTGLTGWNATQAVGRSIFEFATGAARSDLRAQLDEALKTHGQWNGEVWARRSDGGAFPSWLSASLVPDENGQPTHAVLLYSDLTQSKASQQRIEFLAHHDSLTELPNRLLFRDRVEQAIARAARAGNSIALLFIDLDDFKVVNDTYGHQAGDDALREIARRLRGCLRETDTVGRHGGDEFLIVVTDLTDVAVARQIAVNVRDCLAKPLYVEGRALAIGCTIGIAVHPGDGSDYDTLVRNADAAMYAGKNASRGQIQSFRDPSQLLFRAN